MFDHRFHFDRAHDEVIKGNCLVGRAVTVNERVEDVIVQMVARRGQSFTQFISVELVGAIVVVKFENGLRKEMKFVKLY